MLPFNSLGAVTHVRRGSLLNQAASYNLNLFLDLHCETWAKSYVFCVFTYNSEHGVLGALIFKMLFE